MFKGKREFSVLYKKKDGTFDSFKCKAHSANKVWDKWSKKYDLLRVTSIESLFRSVR